LTEFDFITGQRHLADLKRRSSASKAQQQLEIAAGRENGR
jgi:hypothetical protein